MVAIKTTMEENFSTMQQKFLRYEEQYSNLESMLVKVLEQQTLAQNTLEQKTLAATHHPVAVGVEERPSSGVQAWSTAEGGATTRKGSATSGTVVGGRNLTHGVISNADSALPRLGEGGDFTDRRQGRPKGVGMAFTDGDEACRGVPWLEVDEGGRDLGCGGRDGKDLHLDRAAATGKAVVGFDLTTGSTMAVAEAWEGFPSARQAVEHKETQGRGLSERGRRPTTFAGDGESGGSLVVGGRGCSGGGLYAQRGLGPNVDSRVPVQPYGLGHEGGPEQNWAENNYRCFGLNRMEQRRNLSGIINDEPMRHAGYMGENNYFDRGRGLGYRGVGLGRNNFWGENRARKLEMPIFDGVDVFGWIYRVERFFGIHGFADEEKLMSAGMCLEGSALSWFQWREQRQPFQSWTDFRYQILERFNDTQGKDLYEQFVAIVQEGSVKEYREKFEALAAQLIGVPDFCQEGIFLHGLKPDIRAAVRVQRPQDLMDMMKIAQLIEDRNTVDRCKRGKGIFPNHTNKWIGSQDTPNIEEQEETSKDRKSEVHSGGTFRRLTESELQAKRSKGLCYRCDEKFTPGHQCKARFLQILVVCDDEVVQEASKQEKQE